MTSAAPTHAARRVQRPRAGMGGAFSGSCFPRVVVSVEASPLGPLPLGSFRPLCGAPCLRGWAKQKDPGPGVQGSRPHLLLAVSSSGWHVIVSPWEKWAHVLFLKRGDGAVVSGTFRARKKVRCGPGTSRSSVLWQRTSFSSLGGAALTGPMGALYLHRHGGEGLPRPLSAKRQLPSGLSCPRDGHRACSRGRATHPCPLQSRDVGPLPALSPVTSWLLLRAPCRPPFLPSSSSPRARPSPSNAMACRLSPVPRADQPRARFTAPPAHYAFRTQWVWNNECALMGVWRGCVCSYESCAFYDRVVVGSVGQTSRGHCRHQAGSRTLWESVGRGVRPEAAEHRPCCSSENPGRGAWRPRRPRSDS